jgi:hypothetical protein
MAIRMPRSLDVLFAIAAANECGGYYITERISGMFGGVSQGSQSQTIEPDSSQTSLANSLCLMVFKSHVKICLVSNYLIIVCEIG